MSEVEFYNKHYISIDDQTRIIDGWSDGPHPEKETEGSECINERGGYQFRLFPDREENPTLFDMDGIPLYKYEDGEVFERTPEEIGADRAVIDQQRAEEQAKVDAIKVRREAVEEVQAMLVTSQINTLAVDDATALRWKMLYPEWSPDGVEYSVGDKVQRQDVLYRCLSPHASQAGWAPELAASLWTEINETHAGTVDDPIPYSGNMALENGKYYSQGGVTYRCTRDTGNPVYNDLAELVGLYVEVA